MFEINEGGGSIDVLINQERLDMSLANKLLTDLSELLNKDGDVNLVLKNVTYMDSSVLGALVSFQKKINQAGKKLVMTDLSPSIKKVFQLTKLDKFFVIKE